MILRGTQADETKQLITKDKKCKKFFSKPKHFSLSPSSVAIAINGFEVVYDNN